MPIELKNLVVQILHEIHDIATRCIYEQSDLSVNRHWWNGKIKSIRRILDRIEQLVIEDKNRYAKINESTIQRAN